MRLRQLYISIGVATPLTLTDARYSHRYLALRLILRMQIRLLFLVRQ